MEWVEVGSGRGEKEGRELSRGSGKLSKNESWLGDMIMAAKYKERRNQLTIDRNTLASLIQK